MSKIKIITLLFTFIILLFIINLSYSADYSDLFRSDLKLAKEYYMKKEYKKTIDIIEKHSEMIFYGKIPDGLYSQVIEALSLLGDSYINIGNIKKAFDMFQEINGMTDYSEPYALYKTALFTLLFDDTKSIQEILYDDIMTYNLSPDYRLYTLLLSVLENSEGKLIPEKVETSLKNKVGISLAGQALVDFLLNRISEDELIAKTDAENLSAIKYFVGLKNERYAGSVQKGKEYYLELYNEGEDLYKWLSAKRLGLFGILIKDYENYFSYSDDWVYIKSSSTLLGRTKPYHVREIMDNDLKTAWVEGKPDDGVGEWVEFTFDPEIILERISLINGYTRSETLYQANNRVKKIRISFDDGTYIDQELKDGELKPQTITLPEPKQIRILRLTILETYKGSKYNDTCISEIKFDYARIPESEMTPAEEAESDSEFWEMPKRKPLGSIY